MRLPNDNSPRRPSMHDEPRVQGFDATASRFLGHSHARRQGLSAGVSRRRSIVGMVMRDDNPDGFNLMKNWVDGVLF